MTLRDYGRILRKHWRLVVVCVLLGIGGAAAAVVTTTPSYSASAQLFVSTPNQGASLSNAYQGSLFSQQQVKSYSEIVATPKVTGPVIAAQHLPFTPDQLAKKISATVPLDTVLINVTVSDTSPARAAAIANGVAAQMVSVVNQLESPAAASASPVRLSVVQEASAPTAPVSPKKKLDLALGLLVGLALGIGGAVLRETLDTTVKNHEELEQVAGRANLGIIGYDSEAAAHPLVLHDAPGAPRAESFRQLRTNLQFVDVDNPPRSVVISSAVSGEGKSTTSCNLAITLAQAGARVLLIDADLRNPSVAAYLGIEGSVGLTDVLTQQATVGDVAQPWAGGLLSVLPSGASPPNPSELLGSRIMADLLRGLEDRYDVVLLDSPPLLPVTDAAVLSRIAGGALLVIRQGSTRREQVERAVSALATVEARLLGTVLNMVPTKGADAEAYGYGYRYQSAARTTAGGAASPRAAAPVSPAAGVSQPTGAGNSPGRPGPSPAPAGSRTGQPGSVLPRDSTVLASALDDPQRRWAFSRRR